jgi:2'-hydroxyisoflavone reductase
MNLLIIGGTRFVGRHLVDAALQRGDQVTLFNRGQSAADPLPAAVQWRRGDRQQDLAALADGHWDAVIDTCGYRPAEVLRMADALEGRIDCYAFISSVSVYADTLQANDERSPLGVIDDVDTDVIDGRTYGPLKALCEQTLTQRLGAHRCLHIRPGLVVGPHDPTQRFTWWPARLARAAVDGRPVLAPGAPSRPLQFIDARDLADFVLQALDQGCRGAFNVVSPPGFTTMGGLLTACAQAAGVTPTLRWMADEDLLRAQVAPWADLPLWLPADGEHAAFMAVRSDPAHAAGLSHRPLDTTVADTLAWWQALPTERQAFTLAGLDPGREAALLAAAAAGDND